MDAKEECEVLMGHLLPMVQHLLEKNHEFYPVGAVMEADGSITQTATYDGNEFPDSQDVINSLIQAHKKMVVENKIKISGIAYNASVVLAGKKTDAILMCFEHQSGYSVTVGVPYSMTFFKKVKYGDLFAQQGNHDVFG